MAKDLKPHIGIFGRMNNGKSSIINKLTGQPLSIVSDHAGTTTDPVRKAVEIFGIGPVVLIDTAGIDDMSELGKQRVEKTYQTIKEIDCAILVIARNVFGEPERKLIEEFKRHETPFIVVHNKSDIEKLEKHVFKALLEEYNVNTIDFSALQDESIAIVEALKHAIPESAFHRPSLLGGIIKPGQTIVLVTPIDDEAPEGRMILPQVMAIRDVLDNDCICVVLKETALKQYFDNNPNPALVVTDSQVFGLVNKIVPQDVQLTSFSIVLARLRGDFVNYLKGTPALSNLKNGDKILMLESCTHEISCGDIGRVKLPNLIRKFTGKNVEFTYLSGLTPIENIGQYAIAIQCGGCVATRKQLINRTNQAVEHGIPITNYGMAIAYMNGIFERVTGVFSR